jgi:5-methylcytosine-specific restriction endonuclease McrA
MMKKKASSKKPMGKQEYIEKTLRRGCYAWKPRTEVLNAARVGRGIYQCSHCKEKVARKEITMDHIVCVSDVRGVNDWNGIISRMFADETGWMALCIPCHQVKTNIENECRRAIKFAVVKMDKELQKFYEDIKGE